MFGRPAQLNSAFTILPILATASSICAGSRRSVWVKLAKPVTSGFLMSIACTSAPSSTRICAVAAPIPDAAPVTITRLPAYCSTSFIGSVLHGDGAFRTVLGTDACLFGTCTVDLGREDLTVPEIVGGEHVGRQDVATTVTDA